MAGETSWPRVRVYIYFVKISKEYNYVYFFPRFIIIQYVMKSDNW